MFGKRIYEMRIGSILQGTWCPSMSGHTKTLIYYIREFYTFVASHNLELH